jgi:hypothetical protein
MNIAVPLVDLMLSRRRARLDLRTPNRGAPDSIGSRQSPSTTKLMEVKRRSSVWSTCYRSRQDLRHGRAIDYFAAGGVRNFAVITPGKTILRKTVDNFTPGHPKSLLSGMEVQPVVITSENRYAGDAGRDGGRLEVKTLCSRFRPCLSPIPRRVARPASSRRDSAKPLRSPSEQDDQSFR